MHNLFLLDSFPNLTPVKILPNHSHQSGISYIEIMIVVAILGIVAAMAIPDLSSTGTVKLDIAAKEIASAIRFAQTEAIRTKTPHGINTHAFQDRVRVYSLPSTIPIFDVYHPIDKKLYTLELKTDPHVAGVDLVGASFAFAGFYSSSTYLGFNTDGLPKYAGFSGDYMLTNGAITLSYNGEQRIISIAPMTGRVSIQ